MTPQNDSSPNRTIRSTCCWPRAWKALAINLVDSGRAPVVIDKARANDIPVVFYNKEPFLKALDSYDKAYYVGTDSKESGGDPGRADRQTS